MSVTLTETSCRSDGSSDPVVLCAYEEGACRVLDHLLGHGVLEARVLFRGRDGARSPRRQHEQLAVRVIPVLQQPPFDETAERLSRHTLTGLQPSVWGEKAELQPSIGGAQRWWGC